VTALTTHLTEPTPPVAPFRHQRVTFAPELVITKAEAFEGCDALAHAGRVLDAAGRPDLAARLGALFNLLESRLAGA